jgi:opacity protein-like surface antigen
MKLLCLLALSTATLTLCAHAGDDGKQAPQQTFEPFDRGNLELEVGAGEFGSFSTTSAKRPSIDYQLDDVRLGWMYDSPRHSGWLRGNNEFLLEAFAAPVTTGPGNYLAGGSLLWRYNFVQPGARLVPYFQLGAGALDNDIHTNTRQREIGEAFEFVLQGGLGLKYMLNDRWAVSAEAGYRHISNADLSSRNEGLNSMGGLVQVSYFFR